jgi:hypothetical protein
MKSQSKFIKIDVLVNTLYKKLKKILIKINTILNINMATHTKNHIKNNTKREFVTAEDGETYAIIKGIKGDARFDIEIIRTGEVIIAKARGNLIKGPSKQRLQMGDTILIQEGNPAYILTKYLEDEVKKLTKMGELVSYKPKQDDSSGIKFEDEAENQEIDNLEIDEDFISGI